MANSFTVHFLGKLCHFHLLISFSRLLQVSLNLQPIKGEKIILLHYVDTPMQYAAIFMAVSVMNNLLKT